MNKETDLLPCKCGSSDLVEDWGYLTEGTHDHQTGDISCNGCKVYIGKTFSTEFMPDSEFSNGLARLWNENNKPTEE